MIVRTLTSLLIAISVLVAAHLARPVGFSGLELASDGTIIDRAFSDENSAFQIGDRVIAVNDRPYDRQKNLTKRVSPWDSEADVRLVSLKNLRTERLEAKHLHQELPEILEPAYYLLQVDDTIAYGETAAYVANMLRERDYVQVQAVPTLDVEDRTLQISRGMPPALALIAVGVAALALFILWAGIPLLGTTLGFFAAGAALWLDVAFPAAQLFGLAMLALGCITGAWLFLGQTPLTFGKVGVRATRTEGTNADGDLLAALERAEQNVGCRLYIVVGAASQAVEIARDYERLVIEPADSVLSATLSMLATEGGVFPRVDVGEDVRDPWGDPLQDLDTAIQIAAAVPITGYGHGPDRWAFVIARTFDTAASISLVEKIAREIDTWKEHGVREAISIQATQGLLHMVRQNALPPPSKAGEAGVVRDQNIAFPSSLDDVIEGVSAPRVVSRADLEAGVERKERQSALDVSSSRAEATHVAPSPPRQNAHLAQVSEGVGVPRTVRRVDLERERAQKSAEDTQTPTASVARAPQRVEHGDLAQEKALRAWAGYLDRRLRADYPVEDPGAYHARDWRRLAALLASEAPALIYGEPGSGKEFAARAVHERSVRADRPIVIIDCDEMAESSVELELFGLRDEPGVLYGIPGGALVLVSPLKLCVSTLEAIVSETRAFDIRLLFLVRHLDETLPLSKSANGAWLMEQVGERCVRIPSLRERPDDILSAARWMLTHYTVLYAGGQPRHFSPSAERWLKAQAWTANYWDLAACVRAAVLRTDADVLDAEALGASSSAAPRAATGDEDMRVRLIQVLHRTDGNKEEAARILGISSDALVRQLRRHGLI